MTGALFHPQGVHGTFCTLLKLIGAFGGHLFVAAAGFGELGRRFESVDFVGEIVVVFNLGHDDGDSVWQAQHFGCVGLIFRGKRSTL